MTTSNDKRRILILSQGVFGGTDVQINKVKIKILSKFEETCVVHTRPLPNVYDLVILPTSEIHRLHKSIKTKSISIWCLGPGALKESLFNSKLKANGFFWFSQLLHYPLARQGMLKFSDEEARYVDSRSGYEQLSEIVPIDVEKTEFRISSIGTTRFLWVGRVSKDFKELSLKRAIKDLNVIARSVDDTYHLDVVGWGDAVDAVKEYSKNLSHLTLEFHGELPLKKIEELILTQNYRASISMGTSAVEAAKYGLPSILIMPMRTDQEFQSVNCYRRLINTRGLSVGEFGMRTSQNNTSLALALSDEPNNSLDLNAKFAEKFCLDKGVDKLMNGGRPTKGVKGIIAFHYFIFQLKKMAKWFLSRSFLR